MGPVMVSTWVQPINLTINSKFGSRLYEGAGVSAIEFSTNLYLVIAGVFVLSVTNVIFPKLSRLTGREAVDLDQMIETTAGCSIPEIFQREGESGFRARERAAAEEAGKRTGVILLTGGGIIKTAENYAALHQNGRIYQLVRDLSLLPTEGRPLSQGADLAAMWRERAPLYARFRDVEIDNSGTVEDTAAAIWRDFCEHSGT